MEDLLGHHIWVSNSPLPPFRSRQSIISMLNSILPQLENYFPKNQNIFILQKHFYNILLIKKKKQTPRITALALRATFMGYVPYPFRSVSILGEKAHARLLKCILRRS